MRGDITYQGELSDGDLHAVGTQVTKTENAGTISNDDDVDLFIFICMKRV